MALKLIVDDINTVPEALRGEYTEKDGKWHLGVDGLEDTTGLKKKVDELLAEKKAAAEKTKAAEADALKAKEEAARKSGDLKTLEETLTAKYAAQLDDLQKQVRERDGLILGGKKDALISELSGMFVAPGVAKLMLNNLVQVEYGEGGAIVQKFVGLDGKPVTTDAKEFAKHLQGEKELASYIKASSASGGGANGGGNGGGGAKTMKRGEFEQLSPSEKMEAMKNKTQVID